MAISKGYFILFVIYLSSPLLGGPSVLQIKFTETRVDPGAVTAQVLNEFLEYSQFLFPVARCYKLKCLIYVIWCSL